MAIGRDSGLSTLCHSCALACQQRPLKMCLGHGYWLSHLLLSLHICVAYLFRLQTRKKYTHTQRHIYIYIYLYIYIYIYIYKFTRNAIVRLPILGVDNSRGQETFLAPSADKQTHNRDTYKFTRIYIQQAFINCNFLSTWEIVHVKEQR